jgi:hypothetical protein
MLGFAAVLGWYGVMIFGVLDFNAADRSSPSPPSSRPSF